MAHDPTRRRLARALALGSMLPLGACRPTPEALPVLTHGRAERLPALDSRHVPVRPVDVWMPQDYDGRTRHPVLYLHDGQAMFDGATTMSRSGWHIDRAVAAWTAQRRAAALPAVAPLVVAVWSHPTQRHTEYFPQPMLDGLGPQARERAWARVPLLVRPLVGELVQAGRSRSDAYLSFLVDELKPWVDAHFATRPGRADTFLMGSSMGGLISLHGLLSHPQVFGAAAALSPHWVGLFERNDEISDAALAWLRRALPQRPGPLRLYLDRGTIEMDAHYAHAQSQVDALLRERGLGAPDVISRVFEGAGHNERDWGARVLAPLSFLLGGATPRN